MSRRIATLRDLKSDDAEDRPQRDGQAFYAGGSEHSGQQILGPNRVGSDGQPSARMIQEILRQARQTATSSSEGRTTGGPTSLPITFWRNGFTVGPDGELRDFNAPGNREFIECLRSGEIPPELARQVRGGMIDVKLEDKSSQDYKSDGKVQAFSGKGYRLGAPTPETVSLPEEKKD